MRRRIFYLGRPNRSPPGFTAGESGVCCRAVRIRGGTCALFFLFFSCVVSSLGIQALRVAPLGLCVVYNTHV